MSKYLVLALLMLALVGCESKVMHERAVAERVAAEAQREAAIAEQLRYTEETERLRIMSEAASPPYGLMFAGFVFMVVAWLLREWMRVQAVRTEAVRLLPGSAGFERALMDNYGADWYRRNGDYYLRSGEKVKALIEK